MLERLKARVEELSKIVEQSVTQHHGIVGRLNETKEWVKILESEAEKASDEVKEDVKEVVGEIV